MCKFYAISARSPWLVEHPKQERFQLKSAHIHFSHKMESKVKNSISQQATGGAVLSEHSSKRQKTSTFLTLSRYKGSRNTQLALQVFAAQSVSSKKQENRSFMSKDNPTSERLGCLKNDNKRRLPLCAKLEAKRLQASLECRPTAAHAHLKSACFHTFQVKKKKKQRHWPPAMRKNSRPLTS